MHNYVHIYPQAMLLFLNRNELWHDQIDYGGCILNIYSIITRYYATSYDYLQLAAFKVAVNINEEEKNTKRSSVIIRMTDRAQWSVLILLAYVLPARAKFYFPTIVIRPLKRNYMSQVWRAWFSDDKMETHNGTRKGRHIDGDINKYAYKIRRTMPLCRSSKSIIFTEKLKSQKSVYKRVGKVSNSRILSVTSQTNLYMYVCMDVTTHASVL